MSASIAWWLWLLIGALYMAGLLAFGHRHVGEGIEKVQSECYSAFGARPSRPAALAIIFAIGMLLWPAVVMLKLVRLLTGKSE